nr:substrate-binding domain-containing protein [Sphingomonas daechungensis]
MKKIMYALPLAVALAACGSKGGNDAAGGAVKQQLKVVGSSTVYPFTTAVAEQFQKDNPNVSIVVESTGTGAGMKLFCGGVGANFPDMTNASRAIKKSEFESCVANGAKAIIEVPIGIDGLTFIEGKGSELANLTQADIYKALAANPFGKGPNTAQTWKDVNPALPAIKIRVLGPPPTSGTRDSLADLYLEKGCNTDPAMEALKKSDDKKHKDVCTKIREDGAYVEAGENDNLLVQKVSAEPGTLGVLGFSYLEENLDKVKPVQIAGVSPSEKTIADLSYPGARKLYIYLKASTFRPSRRSRTSLPPTPSSGVRAVRLRKRAWFPSRVRTRKPPPSRRAS